MQLSPIQNQALTTVAEWYHEQRSALDAKRKMTKPFFYLAGFAGTGKTTLTKHFIEGLDEKPRLCSGAFTGKAALRMRQAGRPEAQTLHSMIYKAEIEDNKIFFVLDREESVLRDADLLILDECSMVDPELGADVLSFNVPVLVLGDPGQLPPIKGAGFFTQSPDIMLTEVHRQALDSNIIRIATDIRQGKTLKKETTPDAIIYPFRGEVKPDDFDQVLCGKNATRVKMNNYFRKKLGHDGKHLPQPGERIICLRNNRKMKLFNGLMGEVNECSMLDEEDFNNIQSAMPGDVYGLSFTDDEGTKFRDLRAWRHCFDNEELDDMPWRDRTKVDEFTYGYTITVHKSQGSEWESVCVLDDKMFVWDAEARKRWLYTAVTRASKKLCVMGV